jgi:hypothetical protein
VKVSGRSVRIEELADGQVDIGVRFLEMEEQDRNKIYRIPSEQKKHSQILS